MQYILTVMTALIIYFVQSFLYQKYWDRDLQVTVSYSRNHAHIGEVIELTEEIENRKLLPLPVLYVKFHSSRTFLYQSEDNSSLSDYYYRNDIFSILGRQRIIRKQTFRATKRGYYPIDSVNLVAHDLFMRKTYASILKNQAGLYVYPAPLTDRLSLTLVSSIMGELTRKTLFEDPLSFRGIREYTSRDGMRYINWKASARNQQLMVNTYFAVQSSEIVLLLNLDANTIQRSDDLREYLIRVAATLLYHIEKRGLAVRLAVNLTDPHTEGPVVTACGSGEEHFHHLLRTLAALDLSREMTDFLAFFSGPGSVFSGHTRNTTYVIISNYRKESLLLACRKKREAGHHLLFICPEAADKYIPVPDVQLWEVRSDEI